MATMKQKQNGAASATVSNVCKPAEHLWVQVPIHRGWVLLRPDGTLYKILGYEVSTADAAMLCGAYVRTIQAACHEGNHLIEGRDWRRIWPRGGRGELRINVLSVLRLQGLA